MNGPQGAQGFVGASLRINDHIYLNQSSIDNITLNWMTWSNNTVYLVYVLIDQRDNMTVPGALSGDMTGHLVGYNGIEWYDYGELTAIQGLQGPQGKNLC